MSTSITASVTPPATPPAIAPIGTFAPPPPEGEGRVDGAEDAVENTVTVTICAALAEEGKGVGCCEAMSSYSTRSGEKDRKGEGGGDGTEEDGGNGGRRTDGRQESKERARIVLYGGKGGTAPRASRVAYLFIACAGELMRNNGIVYSIRPELGGRERVGY
jgi:hypothetical protein